MLCFFEKVTPRCEFKKQGECLRYVNEPIPIAHLGGQLMDRGRGIKKEPRLDVGCCEYIYERDSQRGLSHHQYRGGDWQIHSLADIKYNKPKRQLKYS